MNIPNMLTVFRLILIPVFILVFFSSITNSLIYAIFIFIISGITDVLDGHIARKYNLVTDWGTIVDPLADKLFLLTVLTCLVVAKYIPIWILAILLCKEGFLILTATILYNKGIIIPANIFGKAATCSFYISIFVFSFNKTAGIYLIYMAVAFEILALINYTILYFKKHKGALTGKKNAGK